MEKTFQFDLSSMIAVIAIDRGNLAFAGGRVVQTSGTNASFRRAPAVSLPTDAHSKLSSIRALDTSSYYLQFRRWCKFVHCVRSYYRASSRCFPLKSHHDGVFPVVESRSSLGTAVATSRSLIKQDERKNVNRQEAGASCSRSRCRLRLSLSSRPIRQNDELHFLLGSFVIVQRRHEE